MVQSEPIRRQSMLGDFLRKKREGLSPLEFGFSAKRRRTPGLRREEVAMLAGVSVTWYMWLEQGRADGVSFEVLNSLATVLKLTNDERNYLLRLNGHIGLQHVDEALPHSAQLILDHMNFPAYIMSYCWDVLCWNHYTRLVFGDFDTILGAQRNMIWYMFTSPEAKNQTLDWETYAQRMVAQLHADYAAYIDDLVLNHLIAQWSRASSAFDIFWKQHPVLERRETTKSIHHPLVGSLAFFQTTLHWVDNPRLRLVTFTPIPGSETENRMQTLMHPGIA
jgi:transcriptional regulator with XRE-family HTH domain